MRKPADHLIASATRVATLYAGHEDFLLLFRGKKGRAALWTKLQKLVSPQRRLLREFILYLIGVSFCAFSLASKCATLRGSGSLPVVQETESIFFRVVDSSRVFSHNRLRSPWKHWYPMPSLGLSLEMTIVGSLVTLSTTVESSWSSGSCTIMALSSGKYADSIILLANVPDASFREDGNETTPSR